MKPAFHPFLTVVLIVAPPIASAIAQNPLQYGKPRIFVADKDGNNVQLLVEIPGMVSHGSPHWGSDGKLILFDATPGERQYQLGRIYACAIGGPFNGNVAEMCYGSCARFSHDMKRIAYHLHPGNPDKRSEER